ncbi:ATP-binding protein [Brevundimonas sp. NIBR11]|uniref:ATP-binding protein n=1 Tax=Brevundimonas sp. NIBR11 TaxID=3015999 RepID=UPI0022F11015|nr:ATP-binding protein [Brevundimonas sp. NIBR11]WGM32572.1 hypothetical protein KKHFBJBL_02826 [Brevundimonas sp. NIBR11]
MTDISGPDAVVKDDDPRISAMPTKAFFVDMFTKDIALDQAVLDLLDNSIDGARAMFGENAETYDGRVVRIELSRDRFRIWDNCGGFDKERARKYAFRFGRPVEAGKLRSSIGQFGVGMKRALFKFGREFTVHSATQGEQWAVYVNAEEWEKDDQDWHFPWEDFAPEAPISATNPGTEIVVKNLRPAVANTFGSKYFENQIIALIKSKHRGFIAKGIEVFVNDIRVQPLELLVVNDAKLSPFVEEIVFADQGVADVRVRIIVGLGDSLPRLAGWYVVCNGRLILDADRRDITGWGVVEDSVTKTGIPGFHNQYARFRGIISFDSEDSTRLPWNTTKTDVDQDNPVWQSARERMIALMRPVIDFLNSLDRDIEEHTRERSPLLKFVQERAYSRFEHIVGEKTFDPPAREDLGEVIRWVKIQYSRTTDDVEFLKGALRVGSAKAVGEKTFDLSLAKHRPS